MKLFLRQAESQLCAVVHLLLQEEFYIASQVREEIIFLAPAFVPGVHDNGSNVGEIPEVCLYDDAVREKVFVPSSSPGLNL